MRKKLLAIASWSYLAVLLVCWLVVRFAGDRWWLATFLLFGPTWVWAMPLFILTPLAAFRRRRLLWPLAVAIAIALFPMMGFTIPWPQFRRADEATVVRVLTCNLKGQCKNNPRLDELIERESPDIVTLQGCWSDTAIAWPKGWYVLEDDKFAVGSRFPLSDPQTTVFEGADGVASAVTMFGCTAQVRGRSVPILSIHLPSPHRGISALLDRKTLIRPARRTLLEQEISRRWQASQQAYEYVSTLQGPVILAGDFNMPAQSTIYRCHWSVFTNAFSMAGFGFGYTEWPQIRSWEFGIRIDHILTGPHWRPVRCWVGPDVGSDHLPLLADLVVCPSE